MPIYDYECSKCGVFEVIQKMSDKPLKANPDCKHKDCPRDAKKLISASAFHLKGGGWYKSDYSNKSSGSAGKTESKDSASTSSDTTAEKKNSSESKADKESKSEGKASLKQAKKGGCGSGGCGCH